MASLLGGLLAGGLGGAGAAVENVTGEMIKTQSAMDLEKLRGEIMAKREMQIAKYRHDLADQPRRKVLVEASRGTPFRSVDEQGTPYDDTLVDKGAGGMAAAATRLGYADLAQKFRAAGEPGFREQSAITAAENERRDARLSEQRIREKGVPQAETAATEDLKRAQAGYAGARTEDTILHPRREDVKERRLYANLMMQRATDALKELDAREKALRADLVMASKEEKPMILATIKEISMERDKHMRTRDAGNELLTRLESSWGGGAGGSRSGGAAPPPLSSFDRGASSGDETASGGMGNNTPPSDRTPAGERIMPSTKTAELPFASKYIKRYPRGGYYFDVPARASPGLRALAGKTFRYEQEAMDAAKGM
jgi:hypothetical protein